MEIEPGICRSPMAVGLKMDVGTVVALALALLGLHAVAHGAWSRGIA